MKAIPIFQNGAAEVLKIQDWPTPQIKPDEVLIEVKAFGLNFADVQARKGQYAEAPPIPYVPGYEVAGVISEVGAQVTRFHKGQAVFAITSFGGYSELAVAKEQVCFALPVGMSMAEGASIPVNFATAYHNLFQTGTLLPGSKVLIHAAAGGVGLAAIQMAKLRNCEIFGTASSPQKLELLREWGVHHPINYVTQDFVAEVMRITQGEGIDLVLDSIAGFSLKKGLSILRPHGRVIGFGGAGLSDRSGLNMLKLVPQILSMLSINAIDLMMKSKGFYGSNLKALGDHRPEVLLDTMENVLRLFAEGKLKTIISKTYPWTEIVRAHQEIESRATTGKIVLTIP